MYSWALVPVRTLPPGTLHNKRHVNPDGWKAQLFFYFFSLLPPSRGYPIALYCSFKISTNLYLTYFLNVLLWNLLRFCWCVPQNPHGSTAIFFYPFLFYYHRQEGNPVHFIWSKKIKKITLHIFFIRCYFEIGSIFVHVYHKTPTDRQYTLFFKHVLLHRVPQCRLQVLVDIDNAYFLNLK